MEASHLPIGNLKYRFPSRRIIGSTDIGSRADPTSMGPTSIWGFERPYIQHPTDGAIGVGHTPSLELSQ